MYMYTAMHIVETKETVKIIISYDYVMGEMAMCGLTVPFNVEPVLSTCLMT